MTLKAVGFVSAGALLVVVAIIMMDLQLLALGTILLSFVVVTRLMRVRVRMRRRVDTERVLEGERVEVKVSVMNASRREAMVVLYDEVPDEVRLVRGSNRQALVLEAGGRTTLRYTIECPLRGHYTLGPLRIRRRDFSNLYFEEEVVEELSYFSVYPRVPQLDRFPVRSFQSSYYEMMPLAKAGLGYEFFCIRDYIKGDPLRRINWKVYARRRDLMVNEYEMENLNDAMIILDAREVTKAGTPLNNPLEMSVKMAASIASFLLKGRNRVGLVTYGDEKGGIVLPPSPGRNQLDGILGALVGVRAGGSEPFISALDRARPYLDPKTTIILISPLDDDDTIVRAARSIMEQYRLFVFSPNSHEIEREVSEAVTKKHLLLELEKLTLMDELGAFGAVALALSPVKAEGDRAGTMTLEVGR